MRVDQSGAAVRTLGAESLADTVSPVPGVTLHPVNFTSDYTIGFNVTVQIMLRLARKIDEIAAREDVNGIVITHGTDVMEEVATFVDLTIATDKPVVFTGAMRNASLPGFDGPHNLLNAILVAAQTRSAGRGVLVCLNDEIHSARAVTKTHTRKTSTFASPGSGPVGVIDNGEVAYFAPATRARRYSVTQTLPEIPLVWVAAGASASQLHTALLEATGIVLAATGIGHVPAWWMPDIRHGIGEGKQIVMASRCGSGPTGLGYAGPGGDFDLAQAGVIFAGYRRPLQTRLELMCALSASLTPQEIRSAFEEQPGPVEA